MPIVIRHHTSCRAPMEAAWAALVDITRWPEWYPHVQAVTHLSGPDAGGLRVGSVWEERVRRGPFTPRFRLTVLECIGGERVTWQARLFLVTGRHTWSVAPAEPGCALHDTYVFSGPLPLLLIGRALFRLFRLREMGRRQLEAWARRAEHLAAHQRSE